MARKPSQKASLRPMIAVLLGALALDQLSKWWVMRQMRLDVHGQIDVWPPLLRFRYGENRGINFGLFDSSSDSMPWILIGLSVVISLALLVWIIRKHRGSLMMQISGGLLIGGALGNVIDRVLLGYVQDFLNMSCCGINNPYVFNIADVFIFAGAIGLAVFEPRSGGSGPRKAKRKKAA